MPEDPTLSLFILEPANIANLLHETGRSTRRVVIRALDETAARTLAGQTCIPAGAFWLDGAKVTCTAVLEDGTEAVLAIQNGN